MENYIFIGVMLFLLILFGILGLIIFNMIIFPDILKVIKKEK